MIIVSGGWAGGLCNSTVTLILYYFRILFSFRVRTREVTLIMSYCFYMISIAGFGNPQRWGDH